MQEKLRNNGLKGFRITKHSLSGLREKSNICELGPVGIESDYDGDDDDDYM